MSSSVAVLPASARNVLPSSELHMIGDPIDGLDERRLPGRDDAGAVHFRAARDARVDQGAPRR
jgi:hypothetical protein